MHNDVTKEQNVLSCYSNCFILRQATMLTEAFNQIKCAIKCVFFLWEMKTFFIWFWRQKKNEKKKFKTNPLLWSWKLSPIELSHDIFSSFFFTRRMKKKTNKIWSLRQNIQHFKRFSLFEWMRSIVDATMSLSDFKVLSSFQFEKKQANGRYALSVKNFLRKCSNMKDFRVNSIRHSVSARLSAWNQYSCQSDYVWKSVIC